MVVMEEVEVELLVEKKIIMRELLLIPLGRLYLRVTVELEAMVEKVVLGDQE